MFRCTVVFLCGCGVDVDIKYNRKALVVLKPRNTWCPEHLLMDEDEAVRDRGSPHRMRTKERNSTKQRRCSCGHVRAANTTWRLRNYADGADIYVCNECVTYFTDNYYKSPSC